jgi:hypothetical protein
MADDGKPRRVDLGLEGGGIVSVRLLEDAYRELESALASGSSQRWHTITSDDSSVTIDLSKVVYVRVDTSSRGVGFSGP